MNAIIKSESFTPAEVFVDKGCEPLLQKVRDEIDAFTPDVTTKDGRKEIAKMAGKVASSKTLLDGLGKVLVSDIKAQSNVIDAERKRVRDTLDKWKIEVRKPLTDFEEVEGERLLALQKRLTDLKTLDQVPPNTPAATIQASLETVQGLPTDNWEEFQDEAESTKQSVVNTLTLKLREREQFEEQQAELAAQKAELEKLQKESAERELADREQRLKDEAGAQAAKDAEAKVEQDRADERARAADQRAKDLAEQERLKAEKKAAEERAAQAERDREHAALQERQRLEREQQQSKQEAERREADVEHRKTINHAAQKALMVAGLGAEDAKKAVIAIAKGEVPNITISY